MFHGSTSRVPKYKHVHAGSMHLSAAELAVMCVLMLRGPQTPGELATRAFRLHEFSGLEEVEATLNSLISREPDPLVMRLPRQPGQKEARFRASAFRRRFQSKQSVQEVCASAQAAAAIATEWRRSKLKWKHSKPKWEC